MEPAHLSSPGAPDPLEQLLREPSPRVADRGFSACVMSAVDADRRRRRTRLCLVIAGAAAGLASAGMAGAFGADAGFAADVQRSFGALVSQVATPAVAVAVVVIGIALVYVFRRGAGDTSAR